jgi:hypothetical protein
VWQLVFSRALPVLGAMFGGGIALATPQDEEAAQMDPNQFLLSHMPASMRRGSRQKTPALYPKQFPFPDLSARSSGCPYCLWNAVGETYHLRCS